MFAYRLKRAAWFLTRFFTKWAGFCRVPTKLCLTTWFFVCSQLSSPMFELSAFFVAGFWILVSTARFFITFRLVFFNGWIFVGFTLAGKNLLFVHPFYEGNLMFKLSAFIVAFFWVLVSTARFLCEWSACRFVCLNCLIFYQVSTLFFVTTAWYLSVCMFAYLLFVDRLICFCWKYLFLSNGFGRKYFWLFYSAFWNIKTTAYFLNCNFITV